MKYDPEIEQELQAILEEISLEADVLGKNIDEVLAPHGDTWEDIFGEDE